LGSEQSFIENRLARRHLNEGTLVLYDVTSTYLEGSHCPLAHHGYSRDKRNDRFKLKRVVVVGDRGMITDARIEQGLRPAGLDWITALRAPAIKDLAIEGGPLQPSLFDD